MYVWFASCGLDSRRRIAEREQAREGHIWPMVGVLFLSVLFVTTVGWLLLGRSGTHRARLSSNMPEDLVNYSSITTVPSSADMSQRQYLISRLRALQVNRSWFFQLVDTSMLNHDLNLASRLLNSSAEDALLQHVWSELAEEWLTRIEQLPPQLRLRLGNLKVVDWRAQLRALADAGISAPAVDRFINISIQSRFMPRAILGRKPPEPYRQLWYAAALQRLEDVNIKSVIAWTSESTTLSAWVPARGARLITICMLPRNHLILTAKGTPLMQIVIFGNNGKVIVNQGLAPVIKVGPDTGSPLQLVVTNKGMASGLITLAYRTSLLPAVITARIN